MTSYMRLLHACPDAPPVDIYVNDNMIAGNLSYRNFTEYHPVQAGTCNVKVYQAGSKGAPFVDTFLNIPANSIHTMATAGRLGGIDLLTFSDRPAFMRNNQASIKFVHLSPDTPDVDAVSHDGKVLFRAVPFKGTTGYTTVNPETYTLKVRLAGTNTDVLTVPNQKLAGGKAYTAYTVGLANQNPPLLQMLTPLDGSSYLKVSDNEITLDSRQADVNGDGVADNVFLVGDRSDPESPFADNITVCVEDGKTGNTACTTPPLNAGYNANLLLADFTHDNANDILVRIDSGGSGGYLYAYIYSFRDNRFLKIFDSEDFNESSQYNAVFKNDYKVEITGRNSGVVFTIDLAGRKDDYADIYDKSGNLIEPVTGGVLGLGGLEPGETDSEGNIGLVALQRIIGKYNSDTLGYIRTVLEWNGSGFTPKPPELASTLAAR